MALSRFLNTSIFKSALVTNAAQPIGRAIALRLASDGFKVAVHDQPHNGDQLLDVYRHIQRLGQHSCVMTGDITDEEQVQSLVQDTSRFLGGLDVMIANPDAVRIQAPVTSTSAETWDRVFAITRGVFLCYKHAALQMISQQRGGRIIGASSSVWGNEGSPSLSAYSASHFAVRGLTQSTALELSQFGITVNTYAPESNDIPHLTEESILEETELNRAALARQSNPQAIANLVSFLVSEDAHHITGQSMITESSWP